MVRIFNTYGPKMDAGDGRVISNFVNQALRGEPVTIYGDGTQTRSLCYVDDMIEGIWRMMDSEPKVTGPVNLGNPEEISMIDLAKKVLELTGSASQLVYHALPEDDPKQRRPDISRAGKLLGWKPETSLEKGLGQVIAYYRGQQNKG